MNTAAAPVLTRSERRGKSFLFLFALMVATIRPPCFRACRSFKAVFLGTDSIDTFSSFGLTLEKMASKTVFFGRKLNTFILLEKNSLKPGKGNRCVCKCFLVGGGYVPVHEMDVSLF